MYCSKCGTQNDDRTTACSSCGASLVPLAASPAKKKGSVGPVVIVLVVLFGFFFVMVVGILAAIAIPSFLKFQKRAKTSEATVNLRRIYDSSVSYFAEDRLDASGNPLPRQFPVSTGPTPARELCSGEGGRFAPQAADWETPTWQALQFAVADSSYYRYEYRSAGTDGGASFTVRAIGDLDCDGELATFEMAGTVDESGSVTSAAGLTSIDELE